MADKLISELTEDAALDGAEELHIIQGGNSRRAAISLASKAGFMGALLTRSSDQNCTNAGAGDAILWDTEQYDTDGFHDATYGNQYLQVPSGLGITHVRVTACVYLKNLTANVPAGIRIYGPAVPFSRTGPVFIEPAVTLLIATACTGVVPVTGGQHFQVYAFSSDANYDVNYQSSCFGIEVVGVE